MRLTRRESGTKGMRILAETHTVFVGTLWLVKVEHPARKGMKPTDIWAMIVPSVATVSWSIFYRRHCGVANGYLVGIASSIGDCCV